MKALNNQRILLNISSKRMIVNSPLETDSAKPFFQSHMFLNNQRLNPAVKRAEYAVRGELAIRAEELKLKLEKASGDGISSLPFRTIINCNIGNPQQLGQKPITFFRQVCSLLDNQDLLAENHRSKLRTLYPKDAIERAEILRRHVVTAGAYTHSQGVSAIREHVARFIEERDGFPSDASQIFLTDGASSGIQHVLNLLIEHSNVGIMLPVPQYPLYSASLALYNGQAVSYYLNEEDEWGLSLDELTRAIGEARAQGIEVRAIVIINPGNPTGQVLREEHMKDVIDFCRNEDLVLLADEVYQTNVYQPEKASFISFKKMLKMMGPSYEGVPLFSFHSVSKGMIGECGRRGGYFECTHVSDDILFQLYKLASISLCSNIMGQIMIDLMAHPPRVSDESYAQYRQEIDDQYASLKRRALMLEQVFNSMEGVTCNPAQGAMYLFPRIHLTKKAIEAARIQNKEPDVFYALAMLESTGVCVVPGSGFGQRPGTYHIRSTFLPLEHQFPEFIAKIKQFHQSFMDRYRDTY